MPINAFPINTIPPAANLIANTPAGIITATNVQNARNQLASAIPSPGPGTHPLFLTEGLDLTTNNPELGFGTTDRTAAKIWNKTDCAVTDPAFSNNEALTVIMHAVNGQNTNAGGTNAKQSFYAINMSG